MRKIELGIHIIVWLTLFGVTVGFELVKFEPLTYESGVMVFLMLISTLTNIAMFYLMAFGILPAYLKIQRMRRFFLQTFGLILAGVVVKSLTLYMLAKTYAPQAPWLEEKFLYLTLPVLSSGLFAILGAGYRFGKDWVVVEAQKRALIHEKIKAELGFLKSQINPHFLFNVLNNLYGLAHREKAEQTSEGILKLAEMMRYMLYECQETQMPLTREVAYLQNYIDLQRLRIANQKVEVRFQIEGDTSKMKVHPLLMVPLVENAFKHGISNKTPGAIELSLAVAEGQALFTVVNPICQSDRAPELEVPVGGFGLENLSRRLKLIDPDRDLLQISETDGKFAATLILPGEFT